ncbi:cytochrome c family protein [Paracoccus sp. (in: a-proteobacteria)]|uniref:c-type cytochrome n=1 Tax=Paracoccus sp. TaxID=267 RepID=UPI00321F83A7
MLNMMNITKAAGALIGSLLFLLLLIWIASGIYDITPASHDGEARVQAYTIPVEGAEEGEAEGEGEAAAEAPDFAAALAAADATAGEKVFGKCKACHKVDGKNSTGPHLDGVVGRAVASVEGFKYSDPMKAHGGDWTPEAIEEFLADPKGVIPGTKMTFAGLKKVEDRANVIAYLQGL